MTRQERKDSGRLLRDLRSRNTETRDRAVARLDAMEPSAARRVLSPVVRWQKHMVGAWRSLFVATAAAFLIPIVWLIYPAERTVEVNMVPFVFASGVVVFLIQYTWLNMHRVKRIATGLTCTNNAGAIGPLMRIDALAEWGRIYNAQIVAPGEEVNLANALVRLLERLGPDDRGLLDGTEHRLLCRLITGDRREVAYAAVEAIARLGDPEGAHYLKQVAIKPKGAVKAAVFPGMGKHAKKGLTQIEERRKREAAAGNLLRPSDSAHAEILLRPPIPAESDPDELLRPA